MRHISRNRIITAVALGALPLLLSTGCSLSIGGPGAVDADQVAERSSKILAEQAGQAPDSFTCTDDLPADVGAEIRCELTEGGESLGVTVKTTSVDGSDVKWDVKVDDAPAGDTAAKDENAAAEDSGPANDGSTAAASGGAVPAEQVARQSATQLEKLVGKTPKDFSCLEDLPARVGAEVRCNFEDGGMTYGATITTTSVNGSSVQWDIKVDDAPL